MATQTLTRRHADASVMAPVPIAALAESAEAFSKPFLILAVGNANRRTTSEGVPRMRIDFGALRLHRDAAVWAEA